MSRARPAARGVPARPGARLACLGFITATLVFASASWARAEAPPGSGARQEPEPLADTAETTAELSALAGALGSAQARARAHAFDALRTLSASALPAIEQRLTALSRRGFDAEGALKAMGALRRVQGIEAVDANVDLARGALPLLTHDRGPGARLAVELMALLRALEAQRSLEAAELIAGKLWPLDGKLFRYEAERTRTRLGVLMIPAFLRHRAHARPHVRALCEEGLAQLGITSPGRAVQQDDVALLSAILTAFGDTLSFDAMPVVVSYLSDERLEVQRAAQHAVSRFGRNAIWQLRERYVNATGKDPDLSWGHKRLRDELTRMFEAPKRERFAAAMAEAERALKAGDLEAARKAADSALRVSPVSAEGARAVPVYDALAERFAARGELTAAFAAASRALRLSPEDPAAARRRARALFLEAELRLISGQVDLKSYQRAMLLDPTLTEAQRALDELTGERRARERRERLVFGALAAALLFLAGVFVLRGRRVSGAGGVSQPRPLPEPAKSGGTHTPALAQREPQ